MSDAKIKIKLVSDSQFTPYTINEVDDHIFELDAEYDNIDIAIRDIKSILVQTNFKTVEAMNEITKLFNKAIEILKSDSYGYIIYSIDFGDFNGSYIEIYKDMNKSINADRFTHNTYEEFAEYILTNIAELTPSQINSADIKIAITEWINEHKR